MGCAIGTTALARYDERQRWQTMYVGRSSDSERPRKVARVSRGSLGLIE